MSRSYKLKSPRTVDLPGGLRRSLVQELGLPPERRTITVGRDQLDRWTISIARADFFAALRRRSWPVHAADAAAIRLERYWSNKPDRDELLISRRAFRRNNRQRMAAHRYEELGFFPHRELTLWD